MIMEWAFGEGSVLEDIGVATTTRNIELMPKAWEAAGMYIF